MIPRVVFDCMVLLQAAGKPAGPAAACFRLAESGVVQLCTSDRTDAEFRDVINRPSLRRQFQALTDQRVADFLETIDRIAILIDPVPEVLTLARDPRDEGYINLTLAAGADYVVTRDNDLLDLMTGTDPDAVAFRTACPNVAILDPAAFLARLRPPTP
jgi:uncharacterized protein